MNKNLMLLYSFALCLPCFARFMGQNLKHIAVFISDFLYVLFPLFVILSFVLLIIYKFCKKPLVEDLFTVSLLNIFSAVMYAKMRSGAYIVDNVMFDISVWDIMLFVFGIAFIMLIYCKNLFKCNIYIWVGTLVALFVRLISLMGNL